MFYRWFMWQAETCSYWSRFNLVTDKWLFRSQVVTNWTMENDCIEWLLQEGTY